MMHSPTGPLTASAVLLVAGVAVGVVDRGRPAAALGLVLLLGALWVRLADIGVSVPEWYTLPAAMLLVLQEPLSGRAVLLGLGCLLLVSGGAVLRWGAPLLYGAAARAVLVVVELAPLGHSVPRWALTGGAGARLLAAGLTWERMLLPDRTTWGHVAALR